jgi:predicted N-acetyltransferase YhbS
MSVSLRPVATADDAQAVHALLERASPVGGRDWRDWHARWLWTHESNPWRLPGVPVGIVAESEGRIVGHLGVTPVPVAWQGETLVTQAAEAFAVDRAWQGKGLGREISAAVWASDVPQPVSFTANPTSVHLFRKFGANRVPSAVDRTRLAVLEAGALVERLRSGRGRAASALRAPGAAALARALAGLWIRGFRTRTRAPRGWSVSALDSRAPEVERVTRAGLRPEVFSVALGADYLAWRYEQAPPGLCERYQLVGVRDGAGVLRAVLALEERRHPEWGGTFTTLMDASADPEAVPAAVLGSVTEYGRARGWVALRVPLLSPAWNAACARFGFLAEAPPTVATVVKPVGKLAGLAAWVDDASHFSLGQGCRW